MINCPEHTLMQAALEEAKKASLRGEIPVGAILVDTISGDIISRSGNLCEELNDPTCHAEINVIRDACQKAGQQRLPNYDLYVTLEPCAMCAAAISYARIRRVYYGAYDPKSGGVDHGGRFYEQKTCHHKPEIYSGIMETACAMLITDFFGKLRPKTRDNNKEKN